MKTQLTYEWKAEYCDADGDIHDNDFSDELAELCLYHGHVKGAVVTRICLVRDITSEHAGVIERGHAYVTNDHLEPYFCTGEKVPRRFHRELAQFLKHQLSPKPGDNPVNIG